MTTVSSASAPSIQLNSSHINSSAVQKALGNRRDRFAYKITNLARAVDKEPFVAGLRKWVMPAVLATSAIWLGSAALSIPDPKERNKRLTQYGLSAAGTIIAAWIGFTKILKPDPNTAGRMGTLILEHMGELLPKKQLAKLTHAAEELLEKSVSELGVAHLFDDKLSQKPLEEALEELEDPDKLLKLLEHLNLPLGKFKDSVAQFAKEAAESDKGLSPKRLQDFRNEMLTHILGEHGVNVDKTMDGWLKSFGGGRLVKKNVASLRHRLEELAHKVDDWQDDILDEAKNALGRRGIRTAADKNTKALAYGRDNHARKLLNVVVDGPGDISSKEMYEEIGELSIMGALPVLGGILGGIAGDAAVGENSAKNIALKCKEGLFQYLANIMLCNVGAMGFIYGMEKLAAANWGKVSEWAGKTSTRIGAMTAGILAIGVIGGSAIANFIGENFLNPLFDGGWKEMTAHLRERTREHGFKGLFENLYEHRVPEPLDVMLHVDDFATGAAISGLSFVEPFLALFYTLSGIRAGVGYRNREGDAPTNTATPVIVAPATGNLATLLPPVIAPTASLSNPMPLPTAPLQPIVTQRRTLGPYQPVPSAFPSVTYATSGLREDRLRGLTLATTGQQRA